MEISSEEELIESLVQARAKREGEDTTWSKDLAQLPDLPEGDQRQAIMIPAHGPLHGTSIDEEGEKAVPSEVEESPVEAEWSFFVRIQNNPDAPNYLQPQSLHRSQETETDPVTHRFERETRVWAPDSDMGGEGDFQEIDEDKANALISQWTQEQPEEEPETEEAETDEEEDEDEEPLPIP